MFALGSFVFWQTPVKVKKMTRNFEILISLFTLIMTKYFYMVILRDIYFYTKYIIFLYTYISRLLLKKQFNFTNIARHFQLFSIITSTDVCDEKYIYKTNICDVQNCFKIGHSFCQYTIFDSENRVVTFLPPASEET